MTALRPWTVLTGVFIFYLLGHLDCEGNQRLTICYPCNVRSLEVYIITVTLRDRCNSVMVKVTTSKSKSNSSRGFTFTSNGAAAE